MKITLLLLGVVLNVFSPRKVHDGCLEIDILLIADISGRVKGHERELNKAITAFIDELELSEDGIHIGIISFSDNANVDLHLTGDHDKFDDKFKNLVSDNGGTDMDKALVIADREFKNNGRAFKHKMLIIVSDGDVSCPDKTTLTAYKLKNEGITICTIMIQNASSKPEFMKDISNECYMQTDYKHLVDELLRMDFCL